VASAKKKVTDGTLEAFWSTTLVTIASSSSCGPVGKK